MEQLEYQILESLLYDMECLSTLDVDENYLKTEIVNSIEKLLNEGMIITVEDYPFNKDALLSEPDRDYWETKYWFKLTPKGEAVIDAFLDKMENDL
jgi:hypothetical protein